MTQIFDQDGNLLPVTLIEVEPVYLLEKVEYSGKPKVRIGCFKIADSKIGKVKRPVKGYFDKLGISPYKLIREVDIDEGVTLPFASSDSEEPKDGDTSASEKTAESKSSDGKEEIKVDTQSDDSKRSDPRQVGVEIFEVGSRVDIRAKTKGKGFAGGMKRHGWSGQPGSHGHTMHRRLGSAGASAYPSKIIKGIAMPGHMGNSFRTTKNLKVLKVDKDKDIIFIQGNIPGARGSVVSLRKV